MKFIPLIEHTRGPMAEIVHAGAIAVVNAQGQLQASAGDGHAMGFTRSTIKPFQALPFLQAGGIERFGFNTQQTALLCASHNGEDMHVAQVDDMLKKTGQSYKALQCGCHVPLRFSYGGLAAPANLQYDERQCYARHRHRRHSTGCGHRWLFSPQLRHAFVQAGLRFCTLGQRRRRR